MEEMEFCWQGATFEDRNYAADFFTMAGVFFTFRQC